jgi:aspartyl-tRNA(Asn)/glutamyl-tRNA(Gln) amidotransferase subunit C
MILEHAARVQTLDAEPNPENAHPLALFNSFRDDRVLPSLDRDEVLECAPETSDGYFVVPPAMEGE